MAIWLILTLSAVACDDRSIEPDLGDLDGTETEVGSKSAGRESSLGLDAPDYSLDMGFDASSIAMLGTVLSVERHGFVLDVATPQAECIDADVRLSVKLPGMGVVSGTSMLVRTDENTIYQLGEEDSRPEDLLPGTPVMVCGALTGEKIAAEFVVDLRNAAPPSEEELDRLQPSGQWRPVLPEEIPEWKRPLSGMETPLGGNLLPDLSHYPGAPFSSDAEVLHFAGQLGGMNWHWRTGDNMNITLLFLVLFYAQLDQVRFTIGFGGYSYDFPFSFEAETTSPLIVGEDGNVNVDIRPEKLTGDYSYYWSLGFSLEMKFELCYFNIWKMRYSCKSYLYPVFGVGWVNATEDAAPMPGKELHAEPLSCIGIDVMNFVGIPIKFIGIQVCQDDILDGVCFESDLLCCDSLYMDLKPGWDCFSHDYGEKEFDGVLPVDLPVRPATNPLNLKFDGFRYVPGHRVEYFFHLYVPGKKWNISPNMNLYDGDMNITPTMTDDCPPLIFTLFDMFLFTCGAQPDGLTLTVPVVPVVTSLEALPLISRTGYPVSLEALVRGANGPGTSPKEVRFFAGGELLSIEPIGGEDVATFLATDLEPCVYEMSARYIGYDDEGGTHPSEKSVMMIVTGDADRARLEGYWQHQFMERGRADFDYETLNCYLDIVEYMSSVFGEEVDASSAREALDVLHMRRNHGSYHKELDRELLVAWLNFADGGICPAGLVDIDNDGTPDMEVLEVLAAAEAVRLDTSASKEKIKEQTRVVHQMSASFTGFRNECVYGGSGTKTASRPVR